MENNKRLEIGQIVYMLSNDEDIVVRAFPVKVISTLSIEDDNYLVEEVLEEDGVEGSIVYLVYDKDDVPYYYCYPNNQKGLHIVTKAEYIELLREKESEVLNKLNELTARKDQVESKITEVEQICHENNHEFGDWQEDQWTEGNNINVSFNEDGPYYTYGRKRNGFVRKCLCCGCSERTLEKPQETLTENNGNKRKK